MRAIAGLTASWVLATLVAAGSVAAQETTPASSLTLYDWMGVAPIVAEVVVLDNVGGRVEIDVATVIRGHLAPETRLLLDQRGANRDREDGKSALKLVRGDRGLVLLEGSPFRVVGSQPLYRVVRGIDGFRRLPAEGRDAWIDAARRLAEVQETKDDTMVWRQLERFLEDPNSILIGDALSLHLRYDRGELRTLAVLRPLLNHPRPDLRAMASKLSGRIVARRNATGTPEADALFAELAARARRDDAADVRAQATRALAAFPAERSREVLRAIASDDPEQSVRYEAERAILEQGRSQGRSD